MEEVCVGSGIRENLILLVIFSLAGDELARNDEMKVKLVD